MFIAASLPPSSLDMPTLSFVAIFIAALLGLFLIVAWLQQRSVRALAWWGAAYLIGASSMALWSAPPLRFALPPELPAAMIFVACGMIWNGARIFHGRRLWPIAAFAGANVWLILCQIPTLSEGSNGRFALGAIVVTIYTFFIAHELWRERRKALYSPTAAVVVPFLHAAIFLMPLAMQAFQPEVFSSSWRTVFVLETMIYAVGTAFIMLLLVKDHHVHIYRSAATTDHLTGLLNRRAFMENAKNICTYQGRRGLPVTLMMLDLDHFKSINDRFGHAVGDEVLRVFAQVARSSMRGSDIVGRLGGEEFAVIVAEPMEFAVRIGERLRVGFEIAGIAVGDHAIGATMSIGAATSSEPVTDLDALIARADVALYRAKHDGRNRLHAEEAPTPIQSAVPIAAAPDGQTAKPAHILQRKSTGRRPKHIGSATILDSATSRLPYPR